MIRWLAVSALVFWTAAPSAGDPAPLRRFAVVVGANTGTADRVPLRYGVADAERFAGVATGLAGVKPEDCLLLRNPTRRAFLDAVADVRRRASTARAATQRVDLLVYYSGHADERGLMLGRELLLYPDLRDAVHGAADVGITILDACASGAITRLKGGRSHPAFLTDTSSRVEGYAFLTSSSENEAAQESERLQGSFFTHALLTGLRGAADVSGDGKVTLGEAYQFAFGETLAQTADTEAGAQHPAYDIKMAGRGDVVMTDLRESSSRLVLGPELDGRFFVLTPERRLVAELSKPYGRSVELGLEPGVYEVYYEQQPQLLASSIELKDGHRHELVRDGMQRARRVPTRRRGEAGRPHRSHDGFEGRSRAQIDLGISDIRLSVDDGPDPTEETFSGIGSGGFTFSHGLRPHLAGELILALSRLSVASAGDTTSTDGQLAVLFGLRYYAPVEGGVRPYAAAAAGPLIDFGGTNQGAFSSGETRGTRLGLNLGGGVDLFLGRHTAFNLDARYLASGYRDELPGFDVALDPLRLRSSLDSPGRWTVRLGFGVHFGRARH